MAFGSIQSAFLALFAFLSLLPVTLAAERYIQAVNEAGQSVYLLDNRHIPFCTVTIILRPLGAGYFAFAVVSTVFAIALGHDARFVEFSYLWMSVYVPSSYVLGSSSHLASRINSALTSRFMLDLRSCVGSPDDDEYSVPLRAMIFHSTGWGADIPDDET